MKKKRYGGNDRDCTSTTRKTEETYKSNGLHKSFNKGRMPLLVKSPKSPQIINIVYTKNNTA